MNLNRKKTTRLHEKGPLAAAFMGSLLIHGVLLVKIDDTSKKQADLSAQKSRTTYINYTIESSFPEKKQSRVQEKKTPPKQKKKRNHLREPALPRNDINHHKAVTSKKSNEQKRIINSTSEQERRVQKTYMTEVLKKIHRMKYYPRLSRRRNEEGTVIVKFTVQNDGTLKGEVVVVRGCIHSSLNAAGRKTIYRSSPFPPFPGNITNKELKFLVDIEYTL